MMNCAYKHIAYNDLDGSTKILPFSSDHFSRLLVKYLANTTSSDDSDTSSSDASGDSFFDSLQDGSSVGARVLLQERNSNKEEESTSAIVNVDFDPEEEDTEELYDREMVEESEDSDDDVTSVIKDQLIEQVLTAWMEYEDPEQLKDMGNLKMSKSSSLYMVNISKHNPDIYSNAMLSTENLASFLPDNYSHHVNEEDIYYFMALNCDTYSR